MNEMRKLMEAVASAEGLPEHEYDYLVEILASLSSTHQRATRLYQWVTGQADLVPQGLSLEDFRDLLKTIEALGK